MNKLKKCFLSIALSIPIFCHTAIALASTVNSMEVRYEGAAKEMVTTDTDFFSKFGTMLPGDKITETVSLKNHSSKLVDFYFRTDLEKDLREAIIALEDEKPSKDPLSRSAALLRDTILRIEIKDQKQQPVLIYEGSLAATALEDFRKVGHYQSEEGGTFTFSLSLPAELTNVYSASNTNVIWIFGVKESDSSEESTTPSISEDPSKPTNPSINPSDPTKPTDPSNPSTTIPNKESGDRDPSSDQILGIKNYKFYIGIGMVTVSIMGLIFLGIRRRRKR